jgi:hypothetical protein
MCKYAERPAIADDVVHGGEEEVLLRRQPQQLDAPQGPLRYIEGLLGGGACQAACLDPLAALGQCAEINGLYGHM